MEESDQVRLLYGDTRGTSEVRCVITRGHTRAHQSVSIESEGKVGLYLGDLSPLAVMMERLACWYLRLYQKWCTIELR